MKTSAHFHQSSTKFDANAVLERVAEGLMIGARDMSDELAKALTAGRDPWYRESFSSDGKVEGGVKGAGAKKNV